MDDVDKVDEHVYTGVTYTRESYPKWDGLLQLIKELMSTSGHSPENIERIVSYFEKNGFRISRDEMEKNDAMQRMICRIGEALSIRLEEDLLAEIRTGNTSGRHMTETGTSQT